MILARSDWVPVTSQLLDLLATPALDRVVRRQHDLARRRHQNQEQTKQNFHGQQRVPFRPIENPVVVLKVFFLAQPDDPQAGRDCSFPASQQGSQQKDLRALPRRVGKGGRKNYNQFQQVGRQCLHMEESSWWSFLPEFTRPAVAFSKIKMDKVEA
jgi:hypothetical protein